MCIAIIVIIITCYLILLLLITHFMIKISLSILKKPQKAIYYLERWDYLLFLYW